MTPDRWKEIEKLYQASIHLPPDQVSAAGGKPELLS
jgi:hypothetical protein